MNFLSPSTRRLQELQRQVPIVGDRALIDLVNGIQVSKDIIRFRKNRGFFGQLLDTLDGSNQQRQLLLDGNLLAGQEALYQWVLEITDSLRISQVALEITQQSLLEARAAIRHQKERLQNQETAFLRLIEVVSNLEREVNHRIDLLEARVRNLEIRVAANEDLDRIITAWTAAQTYNNLPWVFQVALLTREAFTSSVAIYELATGDLNKFRNLLVNKILSHSHSIPKSFFGFADLLDRSCAEMKANDSFARDRFSLQELTTALLEVRSIPLQRLQNTPVLFTIGTSLELAILPENAKPSKIGECAIALCCSQIYPIYRTTDARELVTAIVTETANDCLETLSRSSR